MWDRQCAELSALQAEYDKLRQEHVTQKHKLNIVRDNIDILMINNTKAQDMITKLTNEVQAKQNSFDDLSTAHNDLQVWFDGLKYSMDTMDKQWLIQSADLAEKEAMNKQHLLQLTSICIMQDNRCVSP